MERGCEVAILGGGSRHIIYDLRGWGQPPAPARLWRVTGDAAKDPVFLHLATIGNSSGSNEVEQGFGASLEAGTCGMALWRKMQSDLVGHFVVLIVEAQ